MKLLSMTRSEFEKEYGLIPPGEVNAVVLTAPDGTPFLKIRLVGQQQWEIQQLEKLYKLNSGDQ